MIVKKVDRMSSCVRDRVDFGNLKTSLLKGNDDLKGKQSVERSDLDKNRQIGKSDLLELFEAAEKAADAVKVSVSMSSPEVSRCIEALNQLKRMPESLTCEAIYTTNIGTKLEDLTRHRNPKIQSTAESLLEMWRKIIYTSSGLRSHIAYKKTDCNIIDKKNKTSCFTGKAQKVVSVTSLQRKTNCMRRKPLRVDSAKSLLKKPKPKSLTCSVSVSSAKLSSCSLKADGSSRNKACEILGKALAKVASEVSGNVKEQVLACDPLMVAASLESVMLEKLGHFHGPNKKKYRSIFFNMGDQNNPDLRRKVLLGEIRPEKLIVMEREELGSEKRQMEYQQLKQKALEKEEACLKQTMEWSALRESVPAECAW